MLSDKVRNILVTADVIEGYVDIGLGSQTHCYVLFAKMQR
jgi:hypothetical protein